MEKRKNLRIEHTRAAAVVAATDSSSFELLWKIKESFSVLLNEHDDASGGIGLSSVGSEQTSTSSCVNYSSKLSSSMNERRDICSARN